MIERLTKVKFSNFDKIIFPKIDVTKAQLIQYYIQVAPMMLPFLKDRPLVLTRYPDGVDCEGFFMKDAPSGTPDWVKKVRFYSESAKRSLDYILCNDLDTLIWLANLAAIEIHVPMSRADDRETPDFAFFDIAIIDICDFKFSSAGRLQSLDNFEYFRVIHINAGDRIL